MGNMTCNFCGVQLEKSSGSVVPAEKVYEAMRRGFHLSEAFFFDPPDHMFNLDEYEYQKWRQASFKDPSPRTLCSNCSSGFRLELDDVKKSRREKLVMCTIHHPYSHEVSFDWGYQNLLALITTSLRLQEMEDSKAVIEELIEEENAFQVLGSTSPEFIENKKIIHSAIIMADMFQDPVKYDRIETMLMPDFHEEAGALIGFCLFYKKLFDYGKVQIDRSHELRRLLATLNAPQWKIWIGEKEKSKAVDRLIELGQKATAPLIYSFTGAGAVHAKRALLRIGELAVPALLNALRDPERQALAAVTLRQMESRKSIYALINALEGPSEAMASVALIEKGAVAVEPLVEKLESETDLTCQAKIIYHLGEFGEVARPALSVLEEFLKHSDWRISDIAEKSVNKIKG